ncbi:MAG: hypothetical protein ABJZ55_13595 [Fuerstiella sp.]
MPGTDRPRRKQNASSSSFLAQAHREYHEAMGAVMGLPVAATVGYFLDMQLQSAPWCLIAGAILGAAATVVSLKELLQKLDKQSEQKRMQKLPETIKKQEDRSIGRLGTEHSPLEKDKSS